MGAQALIFVPLSETAPRHFDRKLVIDILGRDAAEPVGYHCAYPDGSRGEVSKLDGDDLQGTIDHLSFSRFHGRILMERIFELADALEVLLVWTDFGPDEPFACVTRAERLDAVSAAIKTDTEIVVARDASHLNQLVKGSTFEENGW